MCSHFTHFFFAKLTITVFSSMEISAGLWIDCMHFRGNAPWNSAERMIFSEGSGPLALCMSPRSINGFLFHYFTRPNCYVSHVRQSYFSHVSELLSEYTSFCLTFASSRLAMSTNDDPGLLAWFRSIWFRILLLILDQHKIALFHITWTSTLR